MWPPPRTGPKNAWPHPLYYPGGVSERTKLTLAALASAAMPDVPVTGARDCDQVSSQDRDDGVDCAVIQDSSGRLFDVWTAEGEESKRRLDMRVKAARALKDAKEVPALGFKVEQVVAYEPGLKEQGPTGLVAVAVMKHCPGTIRPLHLLTLDECTAAGTAIGAVHRLRPDFLRTHGYPTYTTEQIAAQLRGWIGRLRKDGHVPGEITDSWARIIETDGLWSFRTCTVHGGLRDGDLLYSGSGLSAVYGWQDMQVNDPARDLAWIFAKLDGSRRNAVIAAYGRMMGSRLDDLIMLRANLWLQMEQVGDFIKALDRADNERIISFKAQVERLAQQLVESRPSRSGDRPKASAQAARPGNTSLPQDGSGDEVHGEPAPSTITVGTLLRGQDQRRAGGIRVNAAGAGETGRQDPGKEIEGTSQENAPETMAISKSDMADLARTQTVLSHIERDGDQTDEAAGGKSRTDGQPGGERRTENDSAGKEGRADDDMPPSFATPRITEPDGEGQGATPEGEETGQDPRQADSQPTRRGEGTGQADGDAPDHDGGSSTLGPDGGEDKAGPDKGNAGEEDLSVRAGAPADEKTVTLPRATSADEVETGLFEGRKPAQAADAQGVILPSGE